MLTIKTEKNKQMKKIILSILTVLTAIVSISQNYEAANWKTRIIDHPEQYAIAAPPTAVQSKAELQSVKQAISKLDEKKLAAIKYWNAGAPAYRWNQVMLKTISWDNPNLILRTPQAWVNLAIYDATILAWKEKIKYKRKHPQEMDASIKPVISAPLTYSYPCEYSVTAAAAATVLAYFMPKKADSILQLAHAAAQSRVDAGVQLPSDIDAGWKLGEQVALQIIEKAKQDGYDKVYQGEVNKDPKKWTGAFAMGIKLPLMTPMVLRTADQFRPAPPPDFEAEMKVPEKFQAKLQNPFACLLLGKQRA